MSRVGDVPFGRIDGESENQLVASHAVGPGTG